MLLIAQTERAVAGLDGFLREHWRLIVPLTLALVGVYLILPRVKRSKSLLGGALAGVGLVLGALWWIEREGTGIEGLVENVLFFSFAGLAVLGGGLMLRQHNPVHASLAFALVVLSSCGLFLLLAAPFLFAATLIVYAGAIVVTFLFVIMLAQQGGISNADLRSREPFLASLAGFVLLGALLFVLDRGYQPRRLDSVIATLRTLATAEHQEDVTRVLGDPTTLGENKSSRAIEAVRQGLRPARGIEDRPGDPLAAAIDNLELAWAQREPAEVKKHAKHLLDQTEARRARLGVVGAGAGATAAPPKLPSANVAAIGKTLFVDHLIAVEMAGFLLLVATIGTIAIVARRSEDLR